MTVLHIIALTLGMAIVGVRVLLIVLVPVLGLVVSRIVSSQNQDGAMMLLMQFAAAAATFVVGLLFHIPWYGCLVAAMLVGVTTYAVRNPEAETY